MRYDKANPLSTKKNIDCIAKVNKSHGVTDIYFSIFRLTLTFYKQLFSHPA